MKITALKCIEHDEIITIQEVYKIRVQIEKGKIITLMADVEDGQFTYWRGKTPEDTKMINKLTGAQRTEITILLDKKSEEDF